MFLSLTRPLWARPSRAAATWAAHRREAGALGVDATVTGVRWADIRDRIFGRIDAISAGGRDYRRDGANTTLYETHATFVDEHTLSLGTGATITAERIVIAAGSRAVVPDVVTASGVPFHTSDTVMRIDGLPERVVVVGGGYIAAEFAGIFHGFGSSVTQVNRTSRLLRGHDAEISGRFAAAAASRWRLELGFSLQSIQDNGNGTVVVNFVEGAIGVFVVKCGRPVCRLVRADLTGCAS